MLSACHGDGEMKKFSKGAIMSVFKCKMCGGTLEFNQGDTVAVCDYCGTKQTLPRLDDERKANLYDRANHFRRNNEFDKAAGLYEQILNEDSSDAEAYWSLVLCRYGIEYVEDPTTHKRVPTVNRAQFTSIFDDENYRSAIQHADSYQKTIYEEEAVAINEIQKGILAISQKEEPFDVFICYKETDKNGRRTQDSVLANELYHQLIQEGFKVFFSRITLEDKLGTAYEPYIFAALNSAKVMVVLGTKSEHFNAVWVKNEWSRYLALVKESDGKKVLIPAYRDMDPYDLPEEFSHLQAQDMSKLGFMQDLIRGIKKLLPSNVISENNGTMQTQRNTMLDSLLKRTFIFFEDGDFEKANEYLERVLDADPENAKAYMGKLMIDMRVQKVREIGEKDCSFDKNKNYVKFIRFANPDLIDKFNTEIIESKIKKAEELFKVGEYENAVTLFESAIKIDSNSKSIESIKPLMIKAYLSVGMNKIASRLFDEADSIFDNVIIQDKSCGMAYWGKFLCENKCDNTEQLIAVIKQYVSEQEIADGEQLRKIGKLDIVEMARGMDQKKEMLEMFSDEEIESLMSDLTIEPKQVSIEYNRRIANDLDNVKLCEIIKNENLNKSVSYINSSISNELNTIVSAVKKYCEKRYYEDKHYLESEKDKYSDPEAEIKSRVDRAEAKYQRIKEDYLKKKEDIEAEAKRKWQEAIREYNNAYEMRIKKNNEKYQNDLNDWHNKQVEYNNAIDKKQQLENEIIMLQKELKNIKGLFSGGKKIKIENKIEKLSNILNTIVIPDLSSKPIKEEIPQKKDMPTIDKFRADDELERNYKSLKEKIGYELKVHYNGELVNGMRCGYGIQVGPEGDIYEGEWINDVRHGKGKYTCPEGAYYEGEWRDDKRNGYGIQYYSSGDRYEGEWENNQRYGKGKMISSNGVIREGNWFGGRCDGSFVPTGVTEELYDMGILYIQE